LGVLTSVASNLNGDPNIIYKIKATKFIEFPFVYRESKGKVLPGTGHEGSGGIEV
jgi:hypothetical protein